jgi:pimeloyl-ACP methyl ester carboxylesterase
MRKTGTDHVFPALLAGVLLVAGFASESWAQDYEREARWRSEVLGNLVVGDAVDLRLPSGRSFLALYTEGKPGQPAVVIVHGSGVHPDHGVIGSLRLALSDMGFATLAIQMPVLAADTPAAEYYPKLFPEAGERIAAAAAWLGSKGAKKPVLVSHSLGAWMSQEYLQKAGGAPFAAYVSLGRSGPLPKLALPVLDVQGENDFPAVLQSASQRSASRQVTIRGADHFYEGKESELAAVLKDFISGL